MSTVQISGSLPATIAEGSGPGDWAGLLALALQGPGSIAAVEAVGTGASYLSLVYDPGLEAVLLAPGARLDHEAFVAAGAAAEIAFSLRIRLADGAVVEDPTVFRIGVLDVDDTPPQSVAFASGGTVAAGEIGAVLGRLAILDPDSDGPFHIAFPEEDAWRFEVVDGNLLKLRDGISLGLDDMPARPLLIEVSDGRNSAGFDLEIRVTSDMGGGDPGPLLDVMAPGETEGSAGLADEARAVVAGEAATLLELGPHPGGGVGPAPLTLSLGDGTEVLLPATVRRIEFADGVLERDPAGLLGQAAALHQAMTGTAADAAALGRAAAALEQGVAPADLLAGDGGAEPAVRPVATVQEALPAQEDGAFLAALFNASLGRAPSAEERTLHLGRLDSGTTRAQVTIDIALGEEALARLGAAHPDGLWAALPPGQDDQAPWDGRPDSPLPAGPAVSPPPVTVELLLV